MDEPDDETVAFAHQVFEHARNGDTATLVTYVEAGLPPNLANQNGDTLLILASRNGHADTVHALLDHGADPAQLNDAGQTALAAAVERRSVRTVRYLLEAGADPDLGDPSARAAADTFDLPGMQALLGGR